MISYIGSRYIFLYCDVELNGLILILCQFYIGVSHLIFTVTCHLHKQKWQQIQIQSTLEDSFKKQFPKHAQSL